MKSHFDIRGNEIPDKLAKKAKQNLDVDMSGEDIERFLFVTSLCACHLLLLPRPGPRPSNAVCMIYASSQW